ncbi:type I-G CRISPR-associated RAMP protein Csb1/Cas7g [Methylomagnum sp.]
MSAELTLNDLKQALAGHAAAFRCVTSYQPAGGGGTKVFPPTYEGGKYATEPRRINGADVPCVLLDSVQSQANRMELALLDAWEAGDIELPVIVVDFTDFDLPKPLRVTSLEAPHRIADAILRDCLYSEDDGNKVSFRRSSLGKALDYADLRNATALFGLCPTSLLFGMWDSTGPRGGLGVKFQRAIVSEMVGLHAVPGLKPSSRIDPIETVKGAGPVFRHKDPERLDGPSWTINPEDALEIGGKKVLFGLSKKKEYVFWNGKTNRVVPTAQPLKIKASKLEIT